MIDFKNATFAKLKKSDGKNLNGNFLKLLIPGEKIVGIYSSMRDYVVFTNKRFISVNVQGLTGKKQDYTSIPYKNITTFSIETAGTFDIDSELELYLSGVGKVKFEFSGNSDIIEIGKNIAYYVL